MYIFLLTFTLDNIFLFAKFRIIFIRSFTALYNTSMRHSISLLMAIVFHSKSNAEGM